MWTSAWAHLASTNPAPRANDASYLPKSQRRTRCSTHPSYAPGMFSSWCGSRKKGHSEFDLAGLVEKSKFIRPQIGVISFHVGRFRHGASGVVCNDKRLVKRAFVGARSAQKARRVFQNRAPDPRCAPRILDYETSIRAGWQGHAKTHGAAVILHVSV